MVDPIGIKAGPVTDRRLVSVGAAAAVAPVSPVNTDALPVESAAAEATKAMASQPPVDAERVSRIKKAVEDGRFPLVPSTIADRLLALRLQWNPNDAS
jgi:negative regulator of flagellin synthesis FlgM